ncbi:cupin domain-containing protein [Chitinophagaceae bacterium LWZ2-11]
MQRKKFLFSVFAATPLLVFPKLNLKVKSTEKPFKVDAGKARYGETVKFLGVHPNDLKISGKDTDGQLAVFAYTGLAKVGPALHLHYNQDEIFYVVEGEYRFVVGQETQVLKAGDTIFLPRNIAHTWLQLTETGKLIYMVQPAGKIEDFFTYMNGLHAKPTQLELENIHAEYGMKLLGPPLVL